MGPPTSSHAAAKEPQTIVPPTQFTAVNLRPKKKIIIIITIIINLF